jgi:glutamate-ammonia-ligase adenylyltransferase
MTHKPASQPPLCELDIDLPAPAGGTLPIAELSAGDADLAALLERSPAALGLLHHLAAGSPFLTGLVRRDPAFCVQALTVPPDEVFDAICRLAQDQADAASDADIIRNLRIARNRMALLVAMADIAAAWDCQTVTAALTRFADTALQAATGFVLAQAAEGPKFAVGNDTNPQTGFVIIAMGKHGAGELNYSSDIDLIVLYDPERAPLKDPMDAAQVYVRLTRQIVAIMQDRTADGYVFRTDLRLRPDPRATQIAISMMAAANYYESMGQNWERAAMIKARAVAGDIELGREFLRQLTPFVYRKYLDFAAIADVQSLKRQMHTHKGHGTIAVLGHNIKVGRGGIREIEFFVQTQQLIAGGRNPALRGSKTLAVLQELVDEGWIEQSACDELSGAYVFLRTIEHRLQMVADQQTQVMPATQQAFDAFAVFCGYANPQDLASRLTATLATVQGHYAALFEDAPELGSDAGSLVFTGGEDDPDTLDNLAGMGFLQATEVSATIRGWHFGRYPATRAATARERLTELMPALLTALSRTGHPDQAFIAFDRFIAGLPAGVQLFSMLKANPFLLELLATVLGSAPRLAQGLSRRPRQLEAVLDPDFFGPMPTPQELSAAFCEVSARATSFEDLLDFTRVAAREKALRIGMRILSETVSVHEAGLAYSNLADAVIETLLAGTWRDLAERHGQVDEGRLAVIAMGKLGGQEMTAASDLDLIMLYDFAGQAEGSDGDRQLAPSQYFARLTQRLITALTSQTAEGDLYEVDMRLRPSGNKGPVATRVPGFAEYQHKQAWTWEKMALTRARVVAGDASLREHVGQIIRDVLCEARDATATLKDVSDMRRRMLDAHPKADHWEIKQVRGGLVEVEFIAQGLQLVHANAHPEILATNTFTALSNLHQAGLLAAADYEILERSGTLYHALTHVLRLCTTGRFSPADAPPGFMSLMLRAASAPDIAALEHQLATANAEVAAIFDRLVGAP